MTYWGYHLLFTLPLLVVLFVLVRSQLRLAHYVCWGITCLIVMIATTPWDNYAAAIGIWGFGEGVSLGYPFRDWADRTPFLGHIPFEEYAFFLIQTTLACLLTVWLMGRMSAKEQKLKC
jgi:lycopene cyclase domain-containing protein